MEVFKITYWDADHGGMKSEPARFEYFEGTFTEAEEHVRKQKSPWGFFYTPHAPGWNSDLHGNGVIQRITRDIMNTEKMIVQLQENIQEMYKNL